MNTPLDTLDPVVARDAQEQAARLVQDAFVQIFRHTLESTQQARVGAVVTISGLLAEWASMADAEGAAARKALLLAGLDQWGLAWSQAFGPACMLGITALDRRCASALMDVAPEGRSPGLVRPSQR